MLFRPASATRYFIASQFNLQSWYIIPHACVRTLRTLGVRNDPMIDIDSQLKNLPAESRKQILDTINSSNASPTSQGSQPNDDQSTHQHKGQANGSLLEAKEKLMQVNSETYQASIIVEYLTKAESLSELDRTFWLTVKQFARSYIHGRNASSHLDLFGNLFETAKSIEDPVFRQQMIFEIGRFIYRQKRVRLDPVNEVEYMDSLVANKRVFVALRLWESRKNREEAQTKYWLENGILFHLDAGLVAQANQLALESTVKLSKKVISALVGAWAYKLRLVRNSELSHKWIAHWVPLLLEEESGEAIEFSDTENAFAALIAARQWTPAVQLLNSIPTLDPDNLTRYLNSSASITSSTEDTFMILFEALVSQSPHMAKLGSVGGSLALSFARSGDLEAAVQVAKDLRAHNVTFPPIYKYEIIKSYVKLHGSTSSTDVQSLITEPESLHVVLRRSQNRKRNKLHTRPSVPTETEAIVQQYLDDGYPLDATLVHQLTRSGAASIQSLIPLAKDTKTWTYIWYTVAKDKSKIEAPLLLKVMLDCGIQPNAQQLVYMCVVFAFEADSPKKGLEALCQHLSQHESEPRTNPILSAIFINLSKKLISGRRIPVKRPKTETELISSSQTPWSDVASRVRKL